MSLSLGHPFVGNDVATRIAGLKSLQNLELMYCSIGDDGLRGIARLPELRSLSINGQQITDAGIEHLRKCRRLEHVTLRAGQLTDKSLQDIAQIPTITRLDLYGSGQPGVSPGRVFTSAGLGSLSQLPNLETLYLTNLDLPGGYSALKNLTHLRELSLMMCSATSQDLDALVEALPNTTIHSATGGGSYISKSRKGAKTP